jgi:hypothetical protein
MRRLLPLVALALVVVACADRAGPQATRSGIAGRVIAFPTCPVLIEISPCPTKPVQTTVSIESEDGRELIHVRTEPDGTFRIDLEPGRYFLGAQPPPSDPHLVPRPATAEVEAGAYARVTVILDTRLREP